MGKRPTVSAVFVVQPDGGYHVRIPQLGRDLRVGAFGGQVDRAEADRLIRAMVTQSTGWPPGSFDIELVAAGDLTS